MNNVSLGGLVEDICVSFGLPLLFICLALANISISKSRGNRKNAGLKLRLSLVFALALFTYLICSLMFQDRLLLVSIWQANPVLYSFVYSVAVCLVLCGVLALGCWQLRPGLWRSNENDQRAEN
jgi:hypothetical protein